MSQANLVEVKRSNRRGLLYGQLLPAARPTLRPYWALGLTAALVLGAVLRLLWVTDMEFKGDEAWTFEQIQQIHQGQPIPWLGIPSSKFFLNPGMSLWVFLPIAECVDIQSPPDLTRAIQIVNVLALLCLVAFALWVVPRSDREVWLWAAALGAVNPLAVLFQRKIWPPSLFPLLILVFLLSWWYRPRRWGAFAWGLVGACLGQVEGNGFFFAAGFVLWGFLFERKRIAWGSWFVGSCLGVVPMLPWLQYLYTSPPHTHGEGAWVHALEGKFWTRWALEPLGFGLDYSMESDFRPFLRYPTVFGIPTYLGLLWHIMAGVTGAVIMVRALRRMRWQRGLLRELFVEPSSATAFTVNAAMWGYGLLLTLSLLPVHRHYMIILFPLQLVWLARLALGRPEAAAVPSEPGDPRPGVNVGRVLLTLLVVFQSLISLQFMTYVHSRPVIRGDYGIPYREQHGPDERGPFAPHFRGPGDA